ncbi:MAG: hypothetical protein ABSH09_22545 [Bryobacteraceae bacterium]|jgi:hypothetical protein
MMANPVQFSAGEAARRLVAALYSESEEQIGQSLRAIASLPPAAPRDSCELEFRDLLTGIVERIESRMAPLHTTQGAVALRMLEHLSRNAA